MAKLEIAVKSLDDLPESVDPKEFYVKGPDGLYYPDLDVDGMPTVKGLVSTLDKFKAVAPDAKRLQERLDRLAEVEKIDPAEFQRLREEAEARKGKETNVELLQREHQRKLEELQQDTQRRIKAMEEERDTAVRRSKDDFLEAQLTAAIAKHRGRPHMLMHELRQHVDVEVGDDGRHKPVVRGPGGTHRVKDSAGNLMTIEDLVATYRENPEWGGAFDPTGKSGSGADPTGGSGPGGRKTIPAGDPIAFGQNLEEIAAGKVEVSQS